MVCLNIAKDEKLHHSKSSELLVENYCHQCLVEMSRQRHEHHHPPQLRVSKNTDIMLLGNSDNPWV